MKVCDRKQAISTWAGTQDQGQWWKYEHLSQSIDTALGDFVHVTIKPSDK